MLINIIFYLPKQKHLNSNAAYHLYIIKQFSINSVVIYFPETSSLE